MTTRVINGKCVVCGEDDPRVLGEYHHTYGRSNDAKSVILLCFGCHRKITIDQNQFQPKVRSHKASDRDKRNFEDVSIGSLLELIGRRLKKRGLDKYADRR